MSRGINEGIISAFHNGILSSTSLMPNGDAFDDAVEMASANPGLGIGIHISLIGERCVAPADNPHGLAGPDGNLPASYSAFVQAYISRRFRMAQVRAEIEAQFERALSTGIPFTHVDSHQHLHMLPSVFDVVLDLARRSGIHTIRIPAERKRIAPSSRGLQTSILLLLCRLCRRRAAGAGMRVVDHFWGLADSGRMDEAHLTAILKSLRPSVNEIMCHPGLADAETKARYNWGYRWDDEHSALVSPAIRRIVETRGIRLASFGEAWEGTGGEWKAES